MRYALLIHAQPAKIAASPVGGGRPAEQAGRAGQDVFDDWVAFTRAVKDAGVLVAAEQLQVADTATSVRLAPASGC